MTRANDIVPVDLARLMNEGLPPVDWLIDPLIPAGRQVGLVAFRGEGKSSLAFEAAIAVAIGIPFLHQPAGSASHVIYIDQEMGAGDLYERLDDLGVNESDPDRLGMVDRYLHYYQLQEFPTFDTAKGGESLEKLVDQWDPVLVVIDTLSKVVEGEENSADTFTRFDRYTGRLLRARQVALLRLDHLGKDPRLGSRGSSAKEADLDVVWQMAKGSGTDDRILEATKGRFGVTMGDQILLRRQWINGQPGYAISSASEVPKAIRDVADLLDAFEIRLDARVREACKALKENGKGKRTDHVSKALRLRKIRTESTSTSETWGNDPQETRQETPETPDPETSPTPVQTGLETITETPETPEGRGSPSLDGKHPGPNDQVDILSRVTTTLDTERAGSNQRTSDDRIPVHP